MKQHIITILLNYAIFYDNSDFASSANIYASTANRQLTLRTQKFSSNPLLTTSPIIHEQVYVMSNTIPNDHHIMRINNYNNAVTILRHAVANLSAFPA